MRRNGLNAIPFSFAGDVIATAGQVAMEVLCLYAILMCMPAVAPGFLHLRTDIPQLAALGITVGWASRFTLLLPWSHHRTRSVLIPLTGFLALAWLHFLLLSTRAWRPGMWTVTLIAPEVVDPRLGRQDVVIAWRSCCFCGSADCVSASTR
jgi:hypothetical protein